MMNLRNNQGLTLIELIVAMAIGTIVAASATTMMLLGLKVYTKSNQMGLRQNELRVAITAMERMVSEASDVYVDNNKVYAAGNGESLLSFADGAILANENVPIMEDIYGFEASMAENLLTIKIWLDNEGSEPYTFSVACRVHQTAVSTFSRQQSPEEILTMAIHDEALAPGVRAFLKVLESQLGSNGRILTESGAGEYYSSWYIGGYEDNPGWNEETPWCVCFVSWALDQCKGYTKGYNQKYANVDKLWTDCVTSDNWKSKDPQPGDIIFFDWIVDSEKNPEHAGVVYAVQDGWVYTIEGNSDNMVKICKYSLEYPCILGYGYFNWA